MGNPPVRVDILQTVDGVEFADVMKRHLRVAWHGVEVGLISRETLSSPSGPPGVPRTLRIQPILSDWRAKNSSGLFKGFE